MQFKEKQKEVQAIIFAAGEAIELARIAETVHLTVEEVQGIVGHIVDDWREYDLPFTLIRLGECVQMCTLPGYASVIRTALTLRRNTPLSQAALEVLAIIAYNQPVTKSFIEQVRGVDSSGVVNSLVEKELIEEAGRLELPGRPIAYHTTANFLRCFSLSSLEDLPQVDMESEGQVEGQIAFEEEQASQ